MLYTHDLWSINLPKGWQVEDEEECTLIYHPEGVGAFQITAFHKESGDITEEDLIDFSEGVDLLPVEFKHLEGFENIEVEDDAYICNWWLRKGKDFAFVTYACDSNEQAVEAKEVESMMDSLQLIAITDD